jgi:hypothetical protein
MLWQKSQSGALSPALTSSPHYVYDFLRAPSQEASRSAAESMRRAQRSEHATRPAHRWNLRAYRACVLSPFHARAVVFTTPLTIHNPRLSLPGCYFSGGSSPGGEARETYPPVNERTLIASAPKHCRHGHRLAPGGGCTGSTLQAPRIDSDGLANGAATYRDGKVQGAASPNRSPVARHGWSTRPLEGIPRRIRGFKTFCCGHPHGVA